MVSDCAGLQLCAERSMMDLGKTSVQPVLSLPIDPAPASMLWGNVTCPLITPIFFAICTLGFPCGASGKESACNAGDVGSIPGSGRSPGEGTGSPLQYSCLENPMDRGTWWATVHVVTRVRHDSVTKPPSSMSKRHVDGGEPSFWECC